MRGIGKDIHLSETLGFAFELPDTFVHLYGHETYFYTIQLGITVVTKKTGELVDWVVEWFGAEDIKPMDIEVGQAVEGVWRPGIAEFDDVLKALKCTETDVHLSEQALRILLNKLDDLLLYIEPDNQHLNVFSHMTRELLILACTELENGWKYYMDKGNVQPMNGRTYTTKDYVQLTTKLYLKDYQFILRSYSNLPPIRPFESWHLANPTVSIAWYDAYNKTKHDRGTHFSEATLWHAINAVVACMVIHCVRFSPFTMFNRNNTFSSIANQHFICQLVGIEPNTFYLPPFTFSNVSWTAPFVLDPRLYGYVKPFQTLPFQL